MKKLLSFLVVMLIALMLFVGCDPTTPTKGNSGNGGTNTPIEKPENPETPTDPETPTREARPEDAQLVNTIFDTIGYLNYCLHNEEAPKPSNVIAPDATTLQFIDPGCSFDVFLGTAPYSVVLFGSVSFEQVDERTINFSCNLEEGTKIKNVPHKIKASANVKTNESGMPIEYEVLEAIFDGEIITGLSDLLNSGLNQSGQESQPEA